MAMKRRTDNKGRILRVGESQRKDGRYQYQYTDSVGKRQCIYDLTLAGLREKEKMIIRDLRDGIRTGESKKITLNILFRKYLENHKTIRKSTEVLYKSYWKNHIKSADIGERAISDIRSSDIVRFYNHLLEKGLSSRTVGVINAALQPCFEMAIEDDLIRKNPCKNAMARIPQTEAANRRAMTIDEQRRFVNFVSKDKVYRHYLPLFTTLLGTGMRIGECLGLTWENLDFKDGLIYVTHSLRYDNYGDGYKLHISKPKTESGKRVIPMMEDVRRQLLKQREHNFMSQNYKECVVDGYSGFVFVKETGNVFLTNEINAMLKRICRKYNKLEERAAEEEKRCPIALPHLSAHVMRHTFCTRFCENETNVKVIQEIMGHSNVGVTMNIYNHVTLDKAKETMKNMEGKMIIS